MIKVRAELMFSGCELKHALQRALKPQKKKTSSNEPCYFEWWGGGGGLKIIQMNSPSWVSQFSPVHPASQKQAPVPLRPLSHDPCFEQLQAENQIRKTVSIIKSVASAAGSCHQCSRLQAAP